MKSKIKCIGRSLGVMVALLGMTIGVTASEQKAEVPFPEGYRSWQHIKSVIFGPGHKSFASDGGKIFHYYANPQAVAGYRAGRFPDGSIIVRETLSTTEGDGESKGILNEGARRAVDVMVKDERLYKETGGWGFERFDSKNDRLEEKQRAQCYTCHAKQKDRDLVFSQLRMTDGVRVTDGAGTPYPEGYRHWTFLHSSMVPPTFDAFGKKPCEKPCMAGVFHFYANDKAMEGLRTGSYPDGAVIAEEMLEWLATPNGGAKEGARRVIGVMMKNSQRYGSTGGWGYGSFDDGSKTDKLDAKKREACHQCHVARKEQGYVFTEYQER